MPLEKDGNALRNKILCFVDGFGENIYLCLYENGETESGKEKYAV
jgi:hypothetical protein